MLSKTILIVTLTSILAGCAAPPPRPDTTPNMAEINKYIEMREKQGTRVYVNGEVIRVRFVGNSVFID